MKTATRGSYEAVFDDGETEVTFCGTLFMTLKCNATDAKTFDAIVNAHSIGYREGKIDGARRAKQEIKNALGI